MNSNGRMIEIIFDFFAQDISDGTYLHANKNVKTCQMAQRNRRSEKKMLPTSNLSKRAFICQKLSNVAAVRLNDGITKFKTFFYQTINEMNEICLQKIKKIKRDNISSKNEMKTY